MEQTRKIPLWVHLACLSITFFGWIGLSVLLGEDFAQSVGEAAIFTVLMAAADAITWRTTKPLRK
jgi:hypothetical protein